MEGVGANVLEFTLKAKGFASALSLGGGGDIVEEEGGGVEEGRGVEGDDISVCVSSEGV